MHFLLPVVLVRVLAPEVFGQYRLLWLAIITVVTLVPMNMSQVLNYFLPRADATGKRLHVHMTMLYLACGGLLGGLVISPWNPLLPSNMRFLADIASVITVLEEGRVIATGTPEEIAREKCHREPSAALPLSGPSGALPSRYGLIARPESTRAFPLPYRGRSNPLR